jgi:Fic-DOC domain mobile mystery protein B
MESNPNKKIILNLPPGATPLTPEEFRDLLPLHITTRKELNDAEFINISKATQKYFLSRKIFRFSLLSIYQTHKDMFGDVWKWAGKKRTTNKNIGVDKVYIDFEMKKFIDDLDYWLKYEMDATEISARIHHRLVFIHPFNNGNGRWARFLTNLFLKDNLNAYLEFPENELFLTITIRNTYIKALQEADTLNYQPLIDLHKKYISYFK